MNIEKTVRLGTLPDVGSVFCKINLSNDGRLSITGVEGPKSNGDCRGSCGQIVMSLGANTVEPAPGWDRDKIARFLEIWDRWHLNDMRAGCEHQRDWPTTEKVEVVTYGLTKEAFQLRKAAKDKAAHAHARRLRGLTVDEPKFSDTELALIELDDWFKGRHSPPDADSPLSGCFEVRKREQKALGWIRQDEHPRGLLSKPCDVCGYKYGTAWKREDVPADVIAELAALPDTDKTPAWV